jgi:hypothetical protein
MKFNKWTLGLAAVGAVSLASAARADEATLAPLNTALSNTTISGYVDVAAQYNPGDQPNRGFAYVGPVAGIPANPFIDSSRKVDNFTLNSVTISLDKPLDESAWAAGYHIDVNAGHDALNALNYDANVPAFGGAIQAQGTLVGVRQAYVALRTPLGNGIDWKFGAFDGVTGYEANTGYLNPNYTRSYGYAFNPASMLGLLASYRATDLIAVQAGIVNRGETFAGYGQNLSSLSSKDYLVTLALTAPDSFGFLKGSVVNFGTIQSFDNNGVNNYSVNATLNTPVTGLKFGFSYDVVQSLTQVAAAGPNASIDGNVFGVYACFQATDKLGLNLRGEYMNGDIGYGSNGRAYEVTSTLQYDLWANVVSRLEFRWDHADQGTAFALKSGNQTANYFTLAANVVYKF